MAHIRAVEACGGAQRDVPSANVAKLCRPPRTCVAPDAYHVIACTYHWLYQICHGPAGGCVEYDQ